MEPDPRDNEFWEFYWETRLQPMENLGKRAAVLAVSQLVRTLAVQTERPLRLLELGCGEGQVLGPVLDAHSQVCSLSASAGVDTNPRSLARCRADYPGVQWLQGDFTDPALLNRLGRFDILLLVNALHEVFSSCFSPEMGEIDLPFAFQQVERALRGAAGCLQPGGWLVLFDGLEPSGDPHQRLRVRFRDFAMRAEFDTFASEYRPFKITYRQVNGPLSIELSRRDFTRYITKSIFIAKPLWVSERLESYQYFTLEQFRAAFARLGLEISELRTLTVNEEKWRHRVEIETPGAAFPAEHILILGHRTKL